MEPENKSLEKERPFGNHDFRFHVKFRGCILDLHHGISPKTIRTPQISSQGRWIGLRKRHLCLLEPCKDSGGVRLRLLSLLQLPKNSIQRLVRTDIAPPSLTTHPILSGAGGGDAYSGCNCETK